jgi:hypothetical protein
VGSYTDFAKLASTSKASFNPTHTHLQENSDGTIASVYFDFVFLVDGKEQNRGSETWVPASQQFIGRRLGEYE